MRSKNEREIVKVAQPVVALPGCLSWLRLQLAAAVFFYMGAACGMYKLALRLTGQQALSTLITLCYLALLCYGLYSWAGA